MVTARLLHPAVAGLAMTTFITNQWVAMKSSFISEFIKANISSVPANAIITPFLPLRVFEPYWKAEKKQIEKEASVGFSSGLAVICSGLGATNVFKALEALKGTRCANVIFIGSCGGLGKSGIGDIMVADNLSTFGIKGFQGKLEACLSRNGVIFSAARIHSVESIKDETEALIDNLEKGGFGGVDLETSVFLRTAAANGLNACAALYVTDKPLKRPFTAKYSQEERDRIIAARDTVVKNAVRFFLD